MIQCMHCPMEKPSWNNSATSLLLLFGILWIHTDFQDCLKYQRQIDFTSCFGFIYCINYAGYFHRFGKCPCNDFSGKQIHYARKINNSFCCPDVCYVAAPSGIRPVRIELLVKNIMKLIAEV